LGRILREPLLHFFVLGAGLFALFAWLRGPLAAAPERIHVEATRIEHSPRASPEPGSGHPRGRSWRGWWTSSCAILYREALALGFDRDDTIVRRRMRQKLEFLSEDIAPVADPDDAALARHLAEHSDAHRIEPQVALRQVFVSRDRRGEAASAHAQARLSADPSADEAGDASLLPASLPLGPLGEVARVFGTAFAEER
jgi:hypothetical protein